MATALPSLKPGRVFSESEAVQHVDELSRAGDPQLLVPLLEESSPCYVGRNAFEVMWLRGYVFQAICRSHLPTAALPFVFEELESGHQAYLVALAAKALRHLPVVPSATANQAAQFLERALLNMRNQDDVLCLNGYRSPPLAKPQTTGVDEILQSFLWLGKNHGLTADRLQALLDNDRLALSPNVRRRIEETIAKMAAGSANDKVACCDEIRPSAFRQLVAALRRPPLHELALEDQDGATLKFGDFFQSHPAVVVFFYTRCDNPNKCSLSISKLAALQAHLRELGIADRVKLAAFTYDPGFDHAKRLRNYGMNRGMIFNAETKFFRTPAGIEPLQVHLGLGVNFIGTMVNRHRLELYLLRADGTVAGTFQRLQWSENEVLLKLQELLQAPVVAAPPANLPHRGVLASFVSVLPSVAWALFPKCPMCFAGYAAALGLGGLQSFAQAGYGWVKALLILGLTAQLVWFVRRFREARRWTALCCGLLGLLALLAGMHWEIPTVSWFGVAGIAVSTWLGRKRNDTQSP